MPKARSPNRDKAYEIYKENEGKIENRRIAEILQISEKTIGGWKCKDAWNDKLNGVLQKNERSTPKEKGGQRNNVNAVGHGAPKENKNAEKHGFFSKYLPAETLTIIQEIEKKEPLDILWDNIQIAYAAIIRAQHIMYVKDNKDVTTTKIGEGFSETGSSKKWEVQQAWDKHATFLKAQARAQSELRSLIKQYDELLHRNWELATEEQKARIAVLKAKVNNEDNGQVEDDGFIEALQGKVDDIWSEE